MSSSLMKKHLGIYKVEPLGELLVDRLKLSKILIAIIFAFIYFGILLILHSIDGHPRPSNLKELFSHPVSYYYYPNLIGISFDLIGNPLFFVFLAILRKNIPSQFMQLEQDNLIFEKNHLSPTIKFVKFLALNRRAQIVLISVVPFIVSLLLVIQSVIVFQPQGIPEIYAIFLSFIGNYAKIVIIFQLIHILLIASSYTFKPRLHLSHPDKCSGIAPFGNLAIIIYGFLFFLALFQGIGTSAGGSAWERAFANIGASIAMVYLWSLFPIAIIIVFSVLVYKPHNKLKKLQVKYLKNSSEAWTEYHQEISSNIRASVKKSKASLTEDEKRNFSNDIDILRVWSNLDEHVQMMHTWPISKARFRIWASIVNPIIPILLPIIIDFVK